MPRSPSLRSLSLRSPSLGSSLASPRRKKIRRKKSVASFFARSRGFLRASLRAYRSYLAGIASGLTLLLCAIALMQYLARDRDDSVESAETLLVWQQNLTTSVERAGLPQRPATAFELGFDLARVNQEGQIILGGYAPPLSKLLLLINGEVLGAMVTDDRGEWLFLSENPFETGQYTLSLEVQIEEREVVYGIETLWVVIPEANFSAETQQPLMVVLPNESGVASRILSQRFSGDKTATGADFIVDTLDYGENGHLSIAGRLRGEKVEMLVYRNNKLVARKGYRGKGAVPVDWQISARLDPSQANLSGQVLRIDLVSNEKVVQRKALPIDWTPLVREGEDEYFVVRSGGSLWHIARRIFGTGTLHTFLYEANKAQIENPDLIRPGQILFIPQKPRKLEQTTQLSPAATKTKKQPNDQLEDPSQ